MTKADKTQQKRFEQTARELGVELDEEKLKETLQKMRYHDTLSGDERVAPKPKT